MEVDNAFQLLAGIEFLSADGFRDRVAHVPAAARWEIPVRVIPQEELEKRDHWWNRNVYSLLTTQAEFTRLLNARTYLTCTGHRIATAASPDTAGGVLCAPNGTAGDSTVVFREQESSQGFNTAGAWRISSNFRWEINLGFADRNVYLGPAAVVGFQTDPGLGTPDFFGILLGGLSMTQVEIEPESYTERFQMQVLWGRSPTYADEQLTKVDGNKVLRNLQSSSRERWQVTTSFQPIQGYYVRGSAEFGHGVPDVARLGIATRVDLQRLIRSIVGEKEPIAKEQ